MDPNSVDANINRETVPASEAAPPANKTHAAVTGGGSALRRYQDVMVGGRSLGRTLYYEWCSWLSPIPGALGLVLRKLFWPRLFGSCGAGTQFGAGVVIRHPNRIHLGQRVVISEGVILDGRNADTDEAIRIGDDTMLANSVMLSCKSGTIRIGAHAGIGAQTIIQSTSGCPVGVGDDVIIGPRCYLVGGGSYRLDRLDEPIWKQGIEPDTGCTVEDNVWLGANVTVLGGVTIASGSVIAAGAVVNRSVGENVICAGVPARVIRTRAPTQ